MSQTSVMHFADTMLSRSKFLRDHWHDLTEFRDPDHPFPISLFGHFGSTIAANFNAMSSDDWVMLSAMIEQGLTSDDDDVDTAVATGLIEGLIHRGEEVESLWRRIEACLGPEARRYADAYRAAV